MKSQGSAEMEPPGGIFAFRRKFYSFAERKNSVWRLYFCTPFCHENQGSAEMEPPGGIFALWKMALMATQVKKA